MYVYTQRCELEVIRNSIIDSFISGQLTHNCLTVLKLYFH